LYPQTWQHTILVGAWESPTLDTTKISTMQGDLIVAKQVGAC